MKLPRRNFLHLAAGAAALPVLSRIARAQSYPSRPINLVITFPAGGAPDIIGRLTGRWLSERLGQPFVIENRPGFGGNIATEYVVRASPDGYTILMPVSTNAMNATLYPNLKFNFMRDIAPVAWPAPGLDDTQLSKSGLPFELQRPEIADHRASASDSSRRNWM
jgi:tripartite-type tricarboxylate transporter receptor subunit TctC